MRHTKLTLPLSILLASGFSNVQAQHKEGRPNILLLLADDLGYGELGSYGQELISTPNLDKLAAEGVRFTDFHAGNAVSSPSRAVLMTGIPSGHNTIRGNKGIGMPNNATRVALKETDVTMAEMLKTGDYQTAFIGKWHLGDPCDMGTWAFARGFDYAAQEQWSDNPCAGQHTEGMEYIGAMQDSIWYDNTKWDCKDEFRTKIAFDYLDNKLEKDKPFFLFMSYRAPHGHEYYINNKDLYADKGWPETERMHAAKITLLDKQIGRLIEKLEGMGLMENTLVLFTSDNGPQNEGHDYDFFKSNGDLRGYKRDTYEGGHRVPCIAYWKGKIQKGLVSDFICGGQDFVPTVAEAAGVRAPKQVQGLSLLSVMKDEKEPRRKAMYWELVDSRFSRQAVRMGNWKATRYGVDSAIRLYDLDSDLGESKDVAAEHPDVIKRIAPLFENMRSENKYFPRRGEDVFEAFCTEKVRSKDSFDKDWKFMRQDNPSFREYAFDDSSWRTLDVPHDWSIEEDYNPESLSEGNSGYCHEGIGWYRKTFSMDPKVKNKQHTIQFDGVFMNSEVWINGNFLGRRPYGYSTFQYDITEYLNYDKENVISVRVDNSIPKASRWYNGSGIYRHVHFITTNFTHFANNGGIFITTPKAEAEQAIVKVDYTINSSFLNEEQYEQFKRAKYSKSGKGEPCLIRSIIFDERGVEVMRLSESKFLNPYEKGVTHTQEVVVDNPIRWSAENPHMYYLKSEIVRSVWKDGKYVEEILDDVVTPFGIRKVDFNADKGLLVNDEQVKLKGVCMHHDAASFGAAVPEKVWVYRLQKLREMGCNAIRTSHNPFAPEFYHICDTMGFYVQDEAFDEWKDGWPFNYAENSRGKASGSYHLYFDQWAETDLRDMIKRDRNHPSIIMYGLGNEVPYFKENGAAKITARLAEISKEEDPTRPVSLGDNASQYTSVNGVSEHLGVIGYNYIRRQHPDSLYGPDRKKFPNKLFYGSETDRNIKYYLAYRDNDYVIGQFIWTGFDYLGETRKQPQRGWQKSLLDVTGNKRHEGYMFECCWSDEPKIHIGVAQKDQEHDKYIYKDGVTHIPVLNTNPELRYEKLWNWEKGEDLAINIFSNCEEVELRLNGKSLGRKKNDMNEYCVAYLVKYAPGTLMAYGYNKGKLVTKDIIKTASKASKFEANVLDKVIKADGEDMSIIEIDICDANGNLVADADNNVKVTVSGAATLAGIDSGNLFYEGNFKTDNRDAYRGKVLAFVKSNGKVGDAKVTISSDKMATKTITIKAAK